MVLSYLALEIEQIKFQLSDILDRMLKTLLLSSYDSATTAATYKVIC